MPRRAPQHGACRRPRSVAKRIAVMAATSVTKIEGVPTLVGRGPKIILPRSGDRRTLGGPMPADDVDLTLMMRTLGGPMPADDVDLTLMIREGQNSIGQNDHRIVPRPARRAQLAAVDALDRDGQLVPLGECLKGGLRAIIRWVTLVDGSLTTEFPRFSPVSAFGIAQHTRFPPHPMKTANGRRRSTCTRFPLMTWLAMMVRPARSALTSTLRALVCCRRGQRAPAGSTRSWAISERSSWKRWGFDASGGAIRRTRDGAPRLCGDVVGLHGRSMGRRKGAPDVGPPRGVSPRRAPPDANIAASLGQRAVFAP